MTEPVPAGHFRCDRCGRTFPKDPEDVVLAEMRENFGDLPPADRAVLCDACYKKFMAWFEKGRK